MTWAVQGGGDENDVWEPEIAWDLQPLADGSVLVTGRYVSEGLFGAGEPNETLLPSFGPVDDDPFNMNCFMARYGRDGDLVWAKGYGGMGTENGGVGISEEADGTFLTTGVYEAEMTIGLGEPNETTLVADTFDFGFDAHVLARFSTDGALDWAISAAEVDGNAVLHGMATIPDGSVVVAGDFDVAIAFTPDTPEETVFTTSDGSEPDMVIARFASNGTLLWARQVFGPGQDEVWDVVRRISGDLLVAGTYQQTVVFGSGETNETSLECGGEESDGGVSDGGVEDEYCPFVASYAEDGSLLWAKDLGFPYIGDRVFPRIAAAPDGGFAISSGFAGTAVLGQGEPNETVIGPTVGEDFDVVIARYDEDGMLLWARQIVGESEDWSAVTLYVGYPMAFLDSGELVVAGNYRHAPVLGLGEPNETTLPHTGSYQVFIALYYPNGNLAWAIGQDGDGPEGAPTVATWGDSTFFVAGYFNGTSVFGTSTEDQKTMTANGDSEIYVLRFDRTGE